MWLPLYLKHRYSELRVHLGGFYLWWVWSAPLCLFWKLWVGSRFYSILEWLLQFVTSDHLLRKLFSSFLLWGGVCLCSWERFPVCSEMLVPAYVASLLISLFIGEVSPLILRDIKEKSLLPVTFLLELEFCSCGYLLLALLKDYFLAFSRA